jgi:hypothetical protein
MKPLTIHPEEAPSLEPLGLMAPPDVCPPQDDTPC